MNKQVLRILEIKEKSQSGKRKISLELRLG